MSVEFGNVRVCNVRWMSWDQLASVVELRISALWFGQSSGKKSILLICWQVVTCLLIGHVMRYANKYGCMIILANAGLTETRDSVSVGIPHCVLLRMVVRSRPFNGFYFHSEVLVNFDAAVGFSL